MIFLPLNVLDYVYLQMQKRKFMTSVEYSNQIIKHLCTLLEIEVIKYVTEEFQEKLLKIQ